MTLVSDVQAAAAEFIADVAELTADTNSADAVITGPAFGAASIVDVGPRSLKTLARVLSEIELSRGWLMRGDWNSGTTYAELDVVGYAGRVWVSMDNANLNNAPAIGSAFWMTLYSGLDGVVPSRAEIPNLTISATTFMCAGFYEMGDAGAGACYSSIGATTGGHMPVYDAVGTLFNLVLVDPLMPGWFGASPLNETVTYAIGGTGPAYTRRLDNVFTTLAEAQDVYPIATSLTQYLGYISLQTMFYAAFGALGSEYGLDFWNAAAVKKCFLPGGYYYLGNDTLDLHRLKGASIEGMSRVGAVIVGEAAVLRFDGLWYSQISGIQFLNWNAASTADHVVRIDGNRGEVFGGTFGVQGNTFHDCAFYASGGTDYCLSINPSFAGQGSEQVFLNCHFSGAEEACVALGGFNGIANKFIGGDMQNYKKHGFNISSAAVFIEGTSFEVVNHGDQFTNGGYDIFTAASSANTPQYVLGCRTEGVRFLFSEGNPLSVRNCSSTPSVLDWFPGVGAPFASLGAVVIVQGATRKMIFQVTTAGTTGGTEPVWPEDGSPIADGSVVWIERSFYHMYSPTSYADNLSLLEYASVGKQVIIPEGPGRTVTITNADYRMDRVDNRIVIWANSSDVTITFPPAFMIPAITGHLNEVEITITRMDTSSHVVTLDLGPFIGSDVAFFGSNLRTLVMDASLAGPQTVVFGIGQQVAGGNPRWVTKSKYTQT